MPYHILHTVKIKWWKDNHERHIVHGLIDLENIAKFTGWSQTNDPGLMDHTLVYQLSYWDSADRD